MSHFLFAEYVLRVIIVPERSVWLVLQTLNEKIVPLLGSVSLPASQVYYPDESAASLAPSRIDFSGLVVASSMRAGDRLCTVVGIRIIRRCDYSSWKRYIVRLNE